MTLHYLVNMARLVFIEIAAFYAQAGYAKLRTSGAAWADGYTLQYYLLQKATPAGLWLAEHLWLCCALSIGVLLFETGFPVAIVVRREAPASPPEEAAR